jgi:hypothetical protein
MIDVSNNGNVANLHSPSIYRLGFSANSRQTALFALSAATAPVARQYHYNSGGSQ